MANAIQHNGETGLQVSLEFPDAKSRGDFEVAFRGWATQYQQAAGTQQIVSTLIAREAAAARGEDTSGYLMTVNRPDGSGWYLDFF